MRRYGGLTNSQARVFVNSSLLNAEASSSEQKQRTVSSSQSNIGKDQRLKNGTLAKKKSSRDALNKKTGTLGSTGGGGGGGGKSRSKRNKGGRNRGGIKNGAAGSKTNFGDSGEDSKTSLNDDQENSSSQSGQTHNGVGPDSKGLGKGNSHNEFSHL